MKRTIEEIRRDVVDHLKWDNRLVGTQISVDIIDQKVVLSGFVKNSFEKDVAETDTRSIQGVSRIENRIQIIQEKYERQSDEQILWNVKSMLALNSQVDSNKIDVSVHKGTVILKGSVDEYWKKLKIEELIQVVSGVSEIINTLTVVHTAIPYDTTIAQDIMDAIERIGTVKTESIMVEVDGGRVVIGGKVPDWYSYSSVHNIVKYTKGVTDLTNNLIISE